MADKKIEVDIDVKTGKVEDSIGQLKALKKQLKDTAAGSEDFSKLQHQITELENQIKGAKKAGSDWVQTLESAGGPLGQLGGAIGKVKQATVSFDAALKATGIGLIVSLIGGLVGAFSQSETAMKKIQPLLIGMEKIFNGVFKAIEPLFNTMIDLATKALPYVSKAFQVVYSSVTAVFQSLGKLGSAVVKLLKGDFAGAWDDAKQSVTKFADNYTQASDRFIEGTKEQTKTQKEEAGKQLEIALKALEAKKKLQDAELEKAKQVALAKADNEKEKNAVEAEYAEKSYQLAKSQLEEKQKLYKKGSNEYKDIQAELIKLDADHTKSLKEELDKRQKLEDEGNKVNVDAYIATLSQRDQEIYKAGLLLNENRKKLELAGITDLTGINEEYRKQIADINKKYDEEDRQKKQKERQDQLLKDLDAAKHDTNKQLEIYDAFEEELKTMKFANLNEELQVRKQISDGILNIIDTQYQNEINATEDKFNKQYELNEQNKKYDADYYEALRQNNQDYQDKLDQQKAKGAITDQEYTKRNETLAKARKEINKQEVASNQEKTKLIGDALGQLSTIVGQDTIAGKAFAIAKATIDTYQSAVAAYKSLAGIPIIGPALGAIAAAAAVASGIATVKKIVSVQVPNAPSSTGGSVSQQTPGTPGERPLVVGNAQAPTGKAQGGLVRGPGGSISDSIPTMLSNGEFVVNAKSARIFQPLLNTINDAGNVPGFAAGGLVTNNKPGQDSSQTIVDAIQQSLGTTPIRTYVTAQDISNQQQFDRTIKSRSLI
jgi:hypothetical protein